MAGGSRGGSAPPGWYIPSRHMHTESLRAHVSAENALQDFCRPQRTRQRAIQPAAAAPASPVPVSQHCRHAYSCSSTAARPPPSLRVSAQPKSLRLAHTSHHTRLQPQRPAQSLKPCNHKPRASRTPQRLATAHPDPHAWRPLSLHMQAARALSSLLPLPHRLTHTAPRKPLQ